MQDNGDDKPRDGRNQGDKEETPGAAGGKEWRKTLLEDSSLENLGHISTQYIY